MCICYEREGVANVGAVAKVLNTTPYHVRKQVNILIEEGYLVKGIRKCVWYESNYSYKPCPPVKGYRLTRKAETTELYLIVKKEEEEAFSKAFGWM